MKKREAVITDESGTPHYRFEQAKHSADGDSYTLIAHEEGTWADHHKNKVSVQAIETGDGFRIKIAGKDPIDLDYCEIGELKALLQILAFIEPSCFTQYHYEEKKEL